MTHGREAAVLALVTALLAGCGRAASSTTSNTTDPGLANYGTPGVVASADRTIPVDILPQGRFDATNLDVRSGETVIFSVTNQSTDTHQFVLGNQQTQDAEEKAMEAMGASAMSMPNTANAVTVAPHTTAQLVWAFPDQVVGEVLFGSHEPGDYDSGLKGVIRIAPSRSNGLGTLGETTTSGP